MARRYRTSTASDLETRVRSFAALNRPSRSPDRISSTDDRKSTGSVSALFTVLPDFGSLPGTLRKNTEPQAQHQSQTMAAPLTGPAIYAHFMGETFYGTYRSITSMTERTTIRVRISVSHEACVPAEQQWVHATPVQESPENRQSAVCAGRRCWSWWCFDGYRRVQHLLQRPAALFSARLFRESD